MKKNLICWMVLLLSMVTGSAFAQEAEVPDVGEPDQARQTLTILDEHVAYPFELSWVVFSSEDQPRRTCYFDCHRPFIVEFSFLDFLYSEGDGGLLPEGLQTLTIDILDSKGKLIKRLYPIVDGRTQSWAAVQPQSVLQLPAGEYAVYLSGLAEEIEEAEDEEELEEEIEAEENGSAAGLRTRRRMSEQPSALYRIGLSLTATFFPEYEEAHLGGDTIPSAGRAFVYDRVIPHYTGGGNLIRTYTSTNGQPGEEAEGYCESRVYDAFGRQHLELRSEPDRGLVQVVRHDTDFSGRRSRSWLPVPVALDSLPLVSAATIATCAVATYGDRHPFTTFAYEAFPEGRLRRQTGPGEAWVQAGKSAETAYLTNLSGNDTLGCYFLQPYLTTQSVLREYPSGSLSVIRLSDEDGRTQLLFRDDSDRTVLDRRIDRRGSDLQIYDTYYVYDRLDRLCAVLPPEASAALPSLKWDEIYRYRYSSDDLLIGRKLPDSDWEYIVYDADRNAVFTQNGNDRALGIWRFRITDGLGRECLVGTCRNRFDPFRSPTHILGIRSVYQGSAGEYGGYGVTGIFLENPVVEQVNYYDHYHFLDAGLFPSANSYRFEEHSDAGFPVRYPSSRGLLTGSVAVRLSAVDAGDSCVFRSYHYDGRSRLIQTRAGRECGLFLTDDFSYDHLDRVVSHRQTVWPSPDEEPSVLTECNTYDQMGRPIHTETTLDAFPSVSVRFTYDALGRLTSRSYDDVVAESYTYNLRGWETSRESDHFSMQLSYESPEHAAPSYTGNITEWRWRHGADAAAQTYAFSYDELSRLTSTSLLEDNVRTDRFVERGLSYDGNGNLLTLQRTENGAVSNDFSYTYDGNRLVTLSDDGTSYAYAYDSNGNLTRDGIHDLDLSYNKLNLIEKVSRDGVTLANYSYLSDGTKLSATNASGDGLVYIGSLVYRKRNGVLSLESAGFKGGRFVATNTGIEPRYFLMDHLGSTRVVVNNFGEVLERNDYHAYGKRWDDANSLLSDNRYGYNGKEKQDFVDLPYIDYGSRMSDPLLGRWFNLDQLSEKYYSTSPFVFCAGNPIRKVDVDGKKWVDANGNPVWENGEWTDYATPSIRELGNTLKSIRTGQEQFDKLVNHSAEIKVTINTTEKPRKYGHMDARRGVTLNSRTGIAQLNSGAEIVIYELNAEDRANASNDRLTKIEAMAVNLGHEIEHTTDHNITLNAKKAPKSEIEKVPNEITDRLVREFEWQKPILDLEKDYFKEWIP